MISTIDDNDWVDNTGFSQNVNIRKLSASTSSSDSINFLKQQLRNCVKYHPACRPASTAPPTRLLRIGPLLDSSQGSDSNVYLVDGSSSVGHPYFTLSHCWGKAQFLQLTKETEAELRAGIPTGTLPKTFRDAIHVCHQLNQQYLWIDSLCIRQDDKEDWRVEAAKMHQVFANAHCNIAATGAVDSSVGLFFDRNPLAHQPFCIQTGTKGRKKWLCLPDWSEYTLLRSPLNRRAWVAQERFLSSRIVHFTSVGLYWDCNTSKMSELYPTHTPPGGLYDFEPMTTLKSVMGVFAARRTFRSKRPKSETKILFESWRDLVVGYSLCGLTKEEDKLIAFNGICHRMRESVGANIICGMWEDFMIDELQWEVNSTFNRQDAPLIENQRAPSWSWASADHHLQEFSFTSEHYYCKQRKEIAEVAHVEAKTFPTGFVESATLVLRGKVTSAKIRIEELTWRAALPAKASCKSGEYEMDSRSFVFDRLPQFPYEEDITLLALSRCFCARGVFTRPPGAADRERDKRVKSSLAVLMLRRLPGNSPTYSRIGLLRLQADDCLMYYDNMSATAEELTLV